MGTVRAQTSTLKKRRYAFRGVRLMSALGHSAMSKACPLYPRKRTFAAEFGMSAKCQRRTLARLIRSLRPRT
jgi:hypothetical protein